VTLNEAYTQGKADVIDLEGNVIITRESDNEMQLLTEQLTVDNANEIAYTDLPVTIISPYGDTDAVGLHASLRDRTINLHSKVKGQYDAPPID
jgi:lipopolysaccharide export system protein LptC